MKNLIGLCVLIILPSLSLAENRFSAKDPNQHADNFTDSINQSTPINTSYMLAKYLSRAKDKAGKNSKQFLATNSSGDTQNILQSVVISPGVTANEIIIINQIEGDGIIAAD